MVMTIFVDLQLFSGGVIASTTVWAFKVGSRSLVLELVNYKECPPPELAPWEKKLKNSP